LGKIFSLLLLLLLTINGGALADQLVVMGQVEDPIEINGEFEGYPMDPWERDPFLLYLAHDGEMMYVHLRVKTEGWVAIGFTQPGGGMHGSNMFLGYFDDEEGLIRDDVAVGRTHSEVDNPAVEEFFVGRGDDYVILEFSYPLSFPEDEDFILAGLNSGDTVGVILAYHNSSQNIRTRHSNRAAFNIEIE